MNRILLTVFIALSIAADARASIVTFSFTGSGDTFIVPVKVNSITISAWGAQGQSNALGVAGGLGGFATGILAVTPGETLFVNVGGGEFVSALGGFNGGGNAGTSLSLLSIGGGGGGASDVRAGGSSLSDRVIVAAGGGGAGGNRVQSNGRGTGGGGGAGYYGGGGGAASIFYDGTMVLATGGTQLGGGIGGISDAPVASNDGLAGALGLGGAGGNEVFFSQGDSGSALSGAAGGGLIGSGGLFAGTSSFTGASGAGGSSFLGTLTSASTTSGLQSGNGFIQFEFATVPEPSGFVLLILATLVTGCYFRFRGSRASQF